MSRCRTSLRCHASLLVAGVVRAALGTAVASPCLSLEAASAEIGRRIGQHRRRHHQQHRIGRRRCRHHHLPHPHLAVAKRLPLPRRAASALPPLPSPPDAPDDQLNNLTSADLRARRCHHGGATGLLSTIIIKNITNILLSTIIIKSTILAWS